MMMHNRILRDRTVGVGRIDTAGAIAWGLTGPNLRATGLACDWRKKRPYSGYENFEFDIPTGSRGDCYDRAAVRVAEMRQSLRIIRQCVDNMPPGEHQSRHPLATPPIKARTMRDIETLITHFLGVSYGPVIPAGEASVMTEGAKGSYSYYLTSDGGGVSYRTRIRTASFPHIQALPVLARGGVIADLIAILGSLDYVLADVDR
jgi:NADH-quinone oxidoreductase subunit C/D